MHPDDAVGVSELTSLSRHVAREPRRHHRWLTAPSGWLLFVCVFLPAWKPCSTAKSLPMLVLPFTWPVYLAGLLIALTVSTRVRRQIEARGAALLVMIRMTAIAVAVFALHSFVEDGVTIGAAIAVKVGTVIALVVPWRATERAIAATSTLTAIAIVAVTAALALSRDTVWGAWVGFAAACALALGCAWWWIELWWVERPLRRVAQ